MIQPITYNRRTQVGNFTTLINKQTDDSTSADSFSIQYT